MRYYNILELYDGDERIFRGTANELAYKFKVKKKTIYCAMNTHKLRGYELVNTFDTSPTEDPVAHEFVLNDEKRDKESRKRQEKEREERRERRSRKDDLNHLILHLEYYGYNNCYCKFDPFPYLPDLYDRGLDCSARSWYSVPEPKLKTTTQHRKTKKKLEGYIVEVKRRWTLRPSHMI